MSQDVFIQGGEFKGSIEREPGENCPHINSETTGKTCRTGCCDEYKCSDCGKTFMVEVPD